MAKLWQNERGATLLELILVIILLGVVLPSLLIVTGLVSVQSAQTGIMEQAVLLAESKMEEINGIKSRHWDWYKQATQFEKDESLPGGFHRQVTVTLVPSWGDAGLKAWEVEVTVSHASLPEGYHLAERFTIYQ